MQCRGKIFRACRLRVRQWPSAALLGIGSIFADDRLGLGPGCTPSRAKMAYIPGGGISAMIFVFFFNFVLRYSFKSWILFAGG